MTSPETITIREEIFQEGHWRSCTGCHELDEGHPTGPWSKIFRCNLGSGCHECGDLGAVWALFADYQQEAALTEEETEIALTKEEP